MKQQNTIAFKDIHSNADGVAILTKHECGDISISLSLKENGDIECTLTKEKAGEIKNKLCELLGDPESTPEKHTCINRGLRTVILFLIVPVLAVIAIHIALLICFTAYHLLAGK